MATEVVTLLRDDIDGSTAERTVNFSWDGVDYEIDLSKKNIAELSATLQPYVASARGVSGRGRRGARSARTRGGRGAATKSGVDLAAVRAWAAANGHSVAARGRISAVIFDAFHAAGGETAAAAKPPARAARRATKATATPRKRAGRPKSTG